MIREYINRRNFIPILKKGPLRAIVKGGEKNLEEAGSNINFLVKQFLPQLAEPEFVKELGRSRGITQWPVETDDEYKIRVLMAYAFWKKGENHLGMEDIIKAFGYEYPEIIEYNDSVDTPAKYATFSVNLGLNASVAETGFLLKLINEVKPARSKLGQLKTLSHTEIPLKTVGPVRKNRILSIINSLLKHKARIPLSLCIKTKNSVCSEVKPLTPLCHTEQKLNTSFFNKESIKNEIRVDLVRTELWGKIRKGIKLKTIISI